MALMNATVVGSADDEELTCSICMDATTSIVLMPCCGRAQSTTQFCSPCIGALCAREPVMPDATAHIVQTRENISVRVVAGRRGPLPKLSQPHLSSKWRG